MNANKAAKKTNKNLSEQERFEIRKERRGFIRDVVLLVLAQVISVLVALLLR